MNNYVNYDNFCSEQNSLSNEKFLRITIISFIPRTGGANSSFLFNLLFHLPISPS